jgi:hypothetical protein
MIEFTNANRYRDTPLSVKALERELEQERKAVSQERWALRRLYLRPSKFELEVKHEKE